MLQICGKGNKENQNDMVIFFNASVLVCISLILILATSYYDNLFPPSDSSYRCGHISKPS